MTANESLNLSLQVNDLLKTDLSHVFHDDIPFEVIENHARELNPESRDRIFTPCNVIVTMLLSATKEDKSLQEALNTFKLVFEHDAQKVFDAESKRLEQEKLMTVKSGKEQGVLKNTCPVCSKVTKSLCQRVHPGFQLHEQG
jgi:hypothetical protein